MSEITWHIVIGGALILLGTSLTAIAAIGLTRFPDLLSRMHAATKPQVLGLMLMMTGLAIVTWDPVVAWTVVLVVAFQLVTAPISAHMVGRSAYRTGRVREQEVEVDEYLEDLVSAVHAKQKAERRAAAEREQHEAAAQPAQPERPAQSGQPAQPAPEPTASEDNPPKESR